MADQSKELESQERKNDKVYGAIFLTSVAGLSVVAGFGRSFSQARRQDPGTFESALLAQGSSLALRALLIGSVYAVLGCAAVSYGIWKISGAENFEDFRRRAGTILPRIPRNDPPQSRTEFRNLTDFLKYVSEEWGK